METASPLPWNELARAIEARYGLQLNRDDGRELANAVERRCRVLREGSTMAYVQRLIDTDDPAEWTALLPMLTIPETFFFRISEHFDFLASTFVPECLAQRGSLAEIRIWSAGCCTGEEPYTISMALMARYPALRLTVLASDLTPEWIERAKRRIYRRWSLRACSDSIIAKFFRPVEAESFELVPEVAERVRFFLLNLIDAELPTPELSNLDAIFCRNVLMYFAPTVAKQVIDRLVACLRPAGCLFLGHAEWSFGHPDLVPLLEAGVAAFRKRSAPAPIPADPWPIPAAPPPIAVPPLSSIIPAPAPPPADRALPPIPVGGQSVGEWLEVARQAANRGAFAEAAEACDQAETVDPMAPEISLFRATLALALDDRETARAALRRTLYVAPDHPLALFHLALLADLSGDTAALRRWVSRLQPQLDGLSDEAVLSAEPLLTVGVVRRWIEHRLSAPVRKP